MKQSRTFQGTQRGDVSSEAGTHGSHVSLIHAGLKQSEKELWKLEDELQQIDQLDRDLKELTHEKELFDLEIRRLVHTFESNFESGVSIGDGGNKNSTSMSSTGGQVADAYVLFYHHSFIIRITQHLTTNTGTPWKWRFI